MKEIELTQRNLNKLEIGEMFIYKKDNCYKSGQIVCTMENNNVMIPLSLLCSIESGLERAKELVNF